MPASTDPSSRDVSPRSFKSVASIDPDPHPASSSTAAIEAFIRELLWLERFEVSPKPEVFSLASRPRDLTRPYDRTLHASPL
jgi:hypothetical protein